MKSIHPLTSFIFIFLSSLSAFSQMTMITSTGRTTGHIATISVENTSDEPFSFKMGPAIIPSKEFKTNKGIQKSQPQIHAGQIDQVIAPGETIEIPVQGFCLDVGKPPLPAGIAMPPLDEWVQNSNFMEAPEPLNPSGTGGKKPKSKIKTNELPSTFKPLTDKGAPMPPDELNGPFSGGGGKKTKDMTDSLKYLDKAVPIPPDELNPGGGGRRTTEDPIDSLKPVDKAVPLVPDELNPGGGSGGRRTHSLLIPGTDRPFNYTIDISEHPEDAARIIFPVVENITTAYDSLHQSGDIQTPFSSNESRQRDAVIQQSIWIATSLLQGQEYGKDEFSGRMEEQFEEASGTKIKEAPEQQQEQFNQGIDQFWDTFELVGEKAKVIKPRPKFEDEIQKSDDCSCDVCQVVEPIRIFNNETGEEITMDTIPWGMYDLRIEPPVLRSNCPDNCNGETITEEIFTHQPHYNEHSGDENENYIIQKDGQYPGRMFIRCSYRCLCDGAVCGGNSLEKEVFLSEANNCCEDLRGEESGFWANYLDFNIGDNQHVRMENNLLTISVENDGERVEEEFMFDVNIQSIFCNLDDNRVISLVDREMQSQLSGNGANELNDASSIGFAGPTNDVEGSDPSYKFRFMKSVMINGEMTEVQVAISVDKATCEFMVSVLFGNEIYENLSDPIYSVPELMTQLTYIQNPFLSYHWNRLIFLYTETLKHESNGDGMQAIMNKIRNDIESLKNGDMITNEKYQSLLSRINSEDPLAITGALSEIAELM